MSENFSDFWPKNFKKISKLPTCPEEKFVTWNFFLKFWIVLDFLQKLSAWFSIFYLRVKSKNWGKKTVFFVFFPEFFRFLSKNFSDFRPKNFKKVFKTTYVSSGIVCSLKVFSKVLNHFGFSANLRHGSQISIYVSRVKIAEKTVFLFYFQSFFELWAKIFQTFGQKTSKKLWKLPSACPEEQLVALNFFKKFWTFSNFLQKPLVWFSKIYLSVQSKNCWRNSFFLFSFSEFFRIFSK